MTTSTAVNLSAVARVVGVQTNFADLRVGRVTVLPQRVVIVGQGNNGVTYASDKFQITTALEAGNRYGFGSPIHLAARELLPDNGDGVGSIPVTVLPLQEGPSATAASGSITPSGTQTEVAEYRVVVNGIQSAAFSIAAGADVATRTAAITAAINAVPHMPVIATDGSSVVNLASKWRGISANDIQVRIDGSTTAGTTFALVQPTGGTINPDPTSQLALIGNVWETLFINCLNLSDTTALNAYSTFGEGRWGPLVRRPCLFFTGTVETNPTTATTISEARLNDRVNSQIPAPGSESLPFVIAARAVARIAVTAQNNPAYDYGSLQLTGIDAGTDGEQWNYVQRDTAVKRGSGTTEVRDGVVTLGDVVTFYHPSGDPVPAYRYVVDTIKLMNILFNIDLIFVNREWDGAPLIPDNQPTVNPAAKKPQNAVSALAGLWDDLGDQAIISDPTFAKANTRAAISSQNPKRLDISTTLKISGNTNIISMDLNWGFFFGTPQPVA